MNAPKSHRTYVLTAVLLAATVSPMRGMAVEPTTLAGALATFITILSPTLGIISTGLEVASFFGDYELIKTSYRIKEYTDTLGYSYRGSQGQQTRTEWHSVDAGPFFRTRSYYRSPDGTVTASSSSDPFPHALEQRTYWCTTADGMDLAIDSRLQLEIGYTATRAPSLSYFLTPNPVPVTVQFTGNLLTESCLDDPKGGFSVARLRNATRDAWTPLALPSGKSMELTRIALNTL